jgi:hypothetical protein
MVFCPVIADSHHLDEQNPYPYPHWSDLSCVYTLNLQIVNASLSS